MKKFASVLLTTSLLISPVAFNSPVEASSIEEEASSIEEGASSIEEGANIVHELQDLAPVNIETRGASAPGSKASTHDISVSGYNYQVQGVGAQVYTDKFIKGKSSMKITVKNWKVIKDWAISPNKLTVRVYNSSGKLIDSDTASMKAGGSTTINFTGLSSTTKYYVEFAVELNKQTYSFDGSIS